MNKNALTMTWDQFRQKYGVYLRLLEAIPEDKFQNHPIPDMRTPAEMIAHVSGSIVRDFATGILEGEIKSQESGEADVARGFADKNAAIAFALECWNTADAAISQVTDEELHATVETPWDMSFPGFVGVSVMNDEFMHHRGQLTAYARACGIEPPFAYGFGDNAPQFQPATAEA